MKQVIIEGVKIVPVHNMLLEIGTEEIPARFMPGALKQLKENGARLLQENRLAFGEIYSCGTPRRLVLFVRELVDKQEDREEKKKGPSKELAFDEHGQPTQAALGFARKLGLTVEELEVEKSEKGEHLVTVQKIPGREAPEVLGGLIPGLIKSISFPKNMYWEESGTRFARPIRWLLCLYGSERVSFSYAGLQSGTQTRGHRFLSPGPFTVEAADGYFACIEEANVLVDQEKRSRVIQDMVRDAAAGCGGRACMDPELLEEVTFLVEKPHAVLCSFPESYLELPREILVTTMQSHQRYFPVENGSGLLMPYFVTVSNNESAPVSNVREGNEKVLKARFADARFFYDEDLKTPLADKVKKLEEILFQEELGTVYEKTERIVGLARFLVERMPGLTDMERKAAERAAWLCKADLTTFMVGEFPELQGIMGEKYALQSGENEKTARAVFEHYQPRFAGDSLPQTAAGAAVALADRADHVAGCFSIGIRPTGSQDPYALRRHSLGILQVLLEHELPVSFGELIEQALLLLKDRLKEINIEETVEQVREFAWQRLRHYFQEKGLDYDLVEAVLNTPLQEIAPLWQRGHFLQKKRDSSELAQATTAYIRVANLASRAREDLEVNEELLQEKGEKKLFRELTAAKERVDTALKRDDLSPALDVLAELKAPIDLFFDEVLVMVEDEKLRFNRLALLRELQQLYLKLADFSKIVFPAHA